MKPSIPIISLSLLPFLLLALTFLLIFPNDLRLQKTLTSSCSTTATTSTYLDPFTAEPDISILFGILTLPSNHERRHLLRTAYSLQQPHLPSTALVHVRFVFCNITDGPTRTLLALEVLLHGDIIVLNCTENMDDGKTFTYFSSLPSILDKPYTYIMKTDDDTYVRLPKLVESLESIPRADLYYGHMLDCNWRGPPFQYMSGLGYMMSWDLVTWISVPGNIPEKEKKGNEDLQVGIWFRDGKKGRNRVDMKRVMHDFPRPGLKYELAPDMVAVHKLKDRGMWATTLSYFNVTRGLNTTSKLYHL